MSETLRQQAEKLHESVQEIATNVNEDYLPLVGAAETRIAEVLAFLEIATGVRPQPDQRLARLDAVVRETIEMVGKSVERAGVALEDGMTIDEVDAFLARQEQADAAIEQARIAATAVVIHLDRALKLCAHA